MPKSLFASRTFWLNALAVLAALAQAVAGQPWLDPEWQAALVAVANIFLRLVTSRPVSVSGSGGLRGLVVLALSGSVVLGGCAGVSVSGVDAARHDAALAYLRASLATVQSACERAKVLHPENAAAIEAQAAPVIAQLRDAVGAYDRAIASERLAVNGSSAAYGAWSVARSVLTSAVSVLGPVVINALASREWL